MLTTRYDAPQAVGTGTILDDPAEIAYAEPGSEPSDGMIG